MSAVQVASVPGRTSRFVANVVEGVVGLGWGLALPDLASFIMLQNILTEERGGQT
jgi:hypothetical protein